MSEFAKCRFCGQEMTPDHGCRPHGFKNKRDIIFVAAKVGEPGDLFGPSDVKHCHDCNAIKGWFHHPGCDSERCPVCGGQAVAEGGSCATCGATLVFLEGLKSDF